MERKIQHVRISQSSRLRSASSIGLMMTLLLSTLPAVFAANNQSQPTTLVAPPPPVVTNYTYGPKGTPRASTGTAASKGAAPAGAPAKITGDETVVQVGRPIIASALNQWQSFSAPIPIKQGTDVSALSLKFVNGDGGPAFQDVRIFLNRRSIGTMQNFSMGKLARPANGLQVGTNSMVIQALGPVGAKLTWKLSESSLQVTSVNPNSFALTDKVTVVGKGFPTNPASVKVTIGKQTVPVSGATATNLTLRSPLPDNLEGGKQDLVVAVGSKKASIKVTVKIAPVLSACDFVATAPGQPVTITGKNFSANASENVVTIAGETCQIVSASPNSLTVIVPMTVGATLPVWNAPIKVKTNDVDSTGDVSVNVGQRVIPNDGAPQL
jgi:IPT/TIG domain